MSDALLASRDALLLDLDGTVYHGARPIPGVAEVLREARGRGTALRFVTNNASKAPADVADHLRRLDIDAEPDEVNTSAQAAARLLAARLPEGAPVLVVGTESLVDEVLGAGLSPTREAGYTGRDVVAVVQGHSPETGWRNLAEACVAVRAGALWVACNVDATLPTERGQLPGNGAMVAALRHATGAEPVIAAKPAPPLFETASESAGAGAPLVVGDRLDTDIAGAVAAGIDALAVLTGVATPASLIAAVPEERPRYLGADLTALREAADTLAIGPRSGWRIAVEGAALTVTAEGERDDPLDLLRALCHTAWENGVTDVRAGDGRATAVLAELGLA
jgi:glycerol 3-phosphatase-2